MIESRNHNMAPKAAHDQIRTALLLAAGTGSRLSPLTNTAHKCLTEVNGVPILKQQVACLEHWNFDELVVVVGHQSDQIREFLEDIASSITVRYVHNDLFRSTNNLHSLWLAQQAVNQPFLLMECDLFFEASLLAGMLQPDRIALATPQPWMNGTTVTLDQSRRVNAYQMGATSMLVPNTYKTVNIHSLSLSTWRQMGRRLDTYVSSGNVTDYYEAVFRDMTVDGAMNAQAVSFDEGNWYEIDTVEDLHAAELLFGDSSHHKPGSLDFPSDARNFTRLGAPMNGTAVQTPRTGIALRPEVSVSHG